jgi:HEAT repeat protein
MRFFTFLLVGLFAFSAGAVTTSAQGSKGKKTQKKEEAAKEATTVNEVGGKTLKELIKDISDPDRSRGVAAMKAVLLFGAERAREAIPAILKELKKNRPGIASVDPGFLINAPTTLTMILSNLKKVDPEHVKDTIKVLKSMLHDPQVVVRHRAAQALMLFGPMARETVPDLIVAARTPSFETRQAAVVALSTVAQPVPIPKDIPKGKESEAKQLAALNKSTLDKAVAALFTAVHDKAAPVRMAAVSSLQALRVPESADHKDKFEKNLEFMAKSDPEPVLRIQAHLVLYPHKTKAGKKTSRDAIAALLKHHVTAVRLQAVQALGRIGADALAEVPALTAAIDDKDGSVGAMALHSIANIGRKDAATKQFLGGLILKNDKPAVRLETIKAVAALGPDADDLLPTLRAAKADKDESISVAALYALASVGRKDTPTKKLLGDWILEDSKPEVRLEAIKAVAAVGEDMANLLPTLLQAAQKDKEAAVQVAAIASIPRMGKVALQVIPNLQQMEANKSLPEAVREAAKVTAEQLSNFATQLKNVPKKGAAR